MREAPRFGALELTRYVAQQRKYWGYTAVDIFKFYGLITGLLMLVALTYARYFDLFGDIHSKPIEYKVFVAWFTGIPLLLLLPAVLGFFWWAAGALVGYTRWQLAQPVLWRWFWFSVLCFYGYVEFDPLDRIHPVMSTQGLAPAPNLLKLFDGEFTTFPFQWGYFILWALLCFLIVVAHVSYFADGLREVWFYTRRFHRYGASILTGFKQTMDVTRSVPVTRDWPREQPQLPAGFRGVPRLNVEQLTAAQAGAIVAADSSGAIVAAPGQPTVLFVDLGRFDFSPALAELADELGTPLLRFEPYWPEPAATREALVVPLTMGGGA